MIYHEVGSRGSGTVVDNVLATCRYAGDMTRLTEYTSRGAGHEKEPPTKCLNSTPSSTERPHSTRKPTLRRQTTTTMSEVVIYPSVYESGRKWLVIHSLYAVVTSFAAALDPELVFGAMGPLLVAVEQTTGLVSWSFELCTLSERES